MEKPLLLQIFSSSLKLLDLFRLKQASGNLQAIFCWPGCFKIQANRSTRKGNHQLFTAVGEAEMELLLRESERWFAVAVDTDSNRLGREIKVVRQYSA